MLAARAGRRPRPRGLPRPNKTGESRAGGGAPADRRASVGCVGGVRACGRAVGRAGDAEEGRGAFAGKKSPSHVFPISSLSPSLPPTLARRPLPLPLPPRPSVSSPPLPHASVSVCVCARACREEGGDAARQVLPRLKVRHRRQHLLIHYRHQGTCMHTSCCCCCFPSPLPLLRIRLLLLLLLGLHLHLVQVPVLDLVLLPCYISHCCYYHYHYHYHYH